MEIKIVFTASNSWFGHVIRWITRSRVSHVYVDVPIWGERFAAEATVGGTRIVPTRMAEHNVVAAYTCQFETRPALQALINELGTPYDWTGVFILGVLAIAAKWLHTKLKRPLYATKSMKCSELVWFFLYKANVLPTSNFKRETTTPGDLYHFCSKSPKFKIVE